MPQPNHRLVGVAVFEVDGAHRAHAEAELGRQFDLDVLARRILEPKTFREPEPAALIYTMAFLYKAATDVDFDFEKLVELAVVAGLGENPDNPFAARSVDVTIDEHLTYDYDRIQEKIEAGTSLSDPEYLAVARLLLSDLSEFASFCRGTDVDIEGKVSAGEALTEGESLVAGGRYLEQPTQFDRETLRELMDDRVWALLSP